MAYQDRKPQLEKNKRFSQAFMHAFDGLKWALKEERNFRTHVALGGVAVVVGFFFQLTQQEWLWMIAMIFLVLLMELLNTVIENIVDFITEHEYHPLAKKIKDLAAGIVLLTACLAVVVAFIILVPKIMAFY